MLDNKYFKYPLLQNGFSRSDIQKGIKVLRSGQVTMSKKTRNFEKMFAKKIGAKHAIMVNSGSSANLLAAFASCNPLRKNKFKPGEEVLIPAICWSTSLWPFVQAGLRPKFVDTNTDTLNIDINDLKQKISAKTRVLVVVHVLGSCSDIISIRNICKKRKIILVEDTCESLGTTYKKKFLGSIGDFGTFSFYYSHQVTSGEGGMIVCHNDEDHDILKSLRSHGWARNLIKQKYYEKKYSSLDNRFIFLNSGFNLRPTEIQASIAQNQFKRMEKIKKIKKKNYDLILNAIINNLRWNNQFTFVRQTKYLNPNWFGLSILINKPYIKRKKKFLEYLTKVGIENRPIISGNFINQPSFKLYNFRSNKKSLLKSQEIEERGFFIGLGNKIINNKTLSFLVLNLLKISKL